MRTVARFSTDSIVFIPTVAEINVALSGIEISMRQLGVEAHYDQFEATEDSLQFMEMLILKGELCPEGLTLLQECLAAFRAWRMALDQGCNLNLAHPSALLLAARFTLVDRDLRKAPAMR